MIVYLDSSAVLRVLLRQAKPLSVWRRWERAYSSELLGVEARRVIDRLRLEGALDDAGVADVHEELARIEGAIGSIPLTRPVLRRAALPMATVVRTPDAIHLARIVRVLLASPTATTCRWPMSIYCCATRCTSASVIAMIFAGYVSQ